MTTVTSRPLILAKYAATTDATEYTATNVRTIIDKFTAYNSDASARIVTVHLVPNGGSADATNLIEATSIAAGATYSSPHVVGHTLESGGFITVKADAATKVVVRATGREVA
jgi:hypothetical protein